MSLKWADRIKETAAAPGTSNVSLGGALSSLFTTFSSFMSNGDTTYYTITDNLTAWEVGLGTWNTGNILVRTTVLASSTGSKINFTNSVIIWCDGAATISPLINSSSQLVSTGGTPISLVNCVNIPVNAAASGSILPAANGGAGTINGIMKANGSGAVSQAVAGSDYAPATSGTVNQLLSPNGTGGFTTQAMTVGNGAPVIQLAGSAVNGHIPQFDGTTGALADSGGIPIGDGSYFPTQVDFVAGYIPTWDASGALLNSGYNFGSFDLAGAAATAQSNAESYTNGYAAPAPAISGSGPSGGGATGQLWIQV